MGNNLLITNIARLVTMLPGAGREGSLGVICDAALRIVDGRIEWMGHFAELPEMREQEEILNAAGGIVMPGLVDCHTHLVHGGFRQNEFNLRSQGKSYRDIAEAGGGIMSTVRATRAASFDELLSSARLRANEALSHGITTIEVKTGYGLNFDTEAKMIEVIHSLGERHPINVVGTSLAAHIVPPEYRDRRDDYIQLLIDKILPHSAKKRIISACDIFVEDVAFTPDEARKIAKAAHNLKLTLHMHVDQFCDGSGAALAAELGAVSADHLDYSSKEGVTAMRDSGIVGVLLPIASFFTGKGHCPNAREMLDQNLTLAIATDYNPGTSPSLDLWMAATIAVTQMGMSCDEALLAITKNAAMALKTSDRGTISPGSRADLIFLDTPDEYFPLYRFSANCVVKTLIAGKVVYERHPNPPLLL